MKNTLQRYILFLFLAKKCSLVVDYLNFFNQTGRKTSLFHIQHQSFQILPFGVIDVDGVIGWLV